MRQPSNQDELYSWYRAALKHGAGSPQAPIHADEPQCGYFRLKVGGDGNGNARVVPAYIAVEAPVDENGELSGDERMICKVGQVDRDPAAAWTWLAGHPVPYDAFQQAWETGQWPDDAPGANFQAADSLEGLTDQLETMLANANKFKNVTTQTECDQAANLKDRIQDVFKALDAMRVAEKKPHDEAARAVQNRFLPWLGKAREAVDALRLAMGPFLQRAQEAAKRAAAEAGGEAAAAALDVRARAGGMGGRRTSLRKKKIAVIVNYDQALAHVKDREEVKALVEKICTSLARAGETKIPGCEVKEETSVV